MAMTHQANVKSDSLSINVRVSGTLKRHVEVITTQGDYESVCEYVRELIRRDKAAQEETAFQLVKAQLQAAFVVPETDYRPVSLDDIRVSASARLK